MKIEKLSALLECSANNTPHIKTLKKYIDILSKMGYSQLYLGLADAYKIEGEPYFNYKRGGYTTEQFKEIDKYAQEHGIELIASIQTLTHLHYLERHYCYKDLLDTRDILMVGEERVYDFIDKMFASVSNSISSRRIHIGYDEAYGLGTGNYFKKHGFKDRKLLLLEHMKRVMTIAEKYGYTCEIWHDMLAENDNTLVTPDMVREILPADAKIFYWNYRINDETVLKNNLIELKQNVKSLDNIAYAGSAFKITGLAPSNSYSISRIIPQMKVCDQLGIKQYMVTVWSDRGAWVNNFSVLPTLFAAAEFANGAFDGENGLDKQKFFDITGVRFDDMMSLDYLNNIHRNPPAKDPCNRSFRILVEDMLLTGYDLLHSEDTGVKYAALADDYSKIDSGEYSHIFKMSEAFARVFSVKARLGADIRQAYKVGDIGVLCDCREQLRTLISLLKQATDVFNEYWRVDNSAFGCEVNQLFLGGQIARTEYVLKVLSEHIETGRKIEELECETLFPSINPEETDDSLFVYDYQWLMTNCGIQ